jgi:metallo-beta-lactamase family protein
MKLHFWGATDEVTGSMTFLELPQGLAMIDCGLTQGTPQTEEINLRPLPFLPSKISAVIITHAHLDHSGYLPRLVKKGFKGPIYCTPPTAKLMRIILLDSAKLNEDEFYDKNDVQETLHLIKTFEWKENFDCLGAMIHFFPAGHILGASSVMIKSENKSIVFSGDLGRTDDPILPPLEPCPAADIVIMESTYGGKVRTGDIKKELHTFLATIATESRVAIVASFAVARAQTLLTLIYQFYQDHPEYKARVVMDSPMMKEANKVYQQYSSLTKLPETVFSALDEIDAIEHQKEWDSLKRKSGPLIIISSSGMLTGGRISRHLENWQDDKRAILYLPGYQGEGTPGRSFLEGKREIKGKEDMFFWTGEVWTSEAFSSHADQNDLLKWVSANTKASQIFLLHGEHHAKLALKAKLEESFSGKVIIPERGTIGDII